DGPIGVTEMTAVRAHHAGAPPDSHWTPLHGGRPRQPDRRTHPRRIRELAEDLPAVWRAPTTAVADRKAMLRIAIEIVALSPVDLPQRRTQIDVQWHIGTASTVFVARPRRGEYLNTAAPIEETIRTLAADGFHDSTIATKLNQAGFSNRIGAPWTLETVRSFRSRRKIPRVAATTAPAGAQKPTGWPPSEGNPAHRLDLITTRGRQQTADGCSSRGFERTAIFDPRETPVAH
ncbi:MAG: hypothetical protein ACI9OJ_004772, partial [Myxococcota bacterium]